MHADLANLMSGANDTDPTHAFQVDMMSSILVEKVRNGNQLTTDEMALFPQAAQVEWFQNPDTYQSETQFVTDAVQSALAKNNITVSSNDSFSVQFDKDLNYTVSGTNAATAKVIEDTINSKPMNRYLLASSLYSQFVPHGLYDTGKTPTTPSEYYAVQLYHYMDYKFHKAADPDYLSGASGEPQLPQFSGAPITFSSGGFSTNTNMLQYVNGTVFNAMA